MNSKRKTFVILTAILLTTITFSLPAQDARRLAVLDFAVQSGRSEYEYLGKGFTEFVAVELAGHPQIRLVDRRMRNTILEEQKFSLTGLTDEAQPLELGKLLTVRYLVSGEIFDMMGRLVITWALMDTETGEVIGTDRVDGTPQEYNRLTSAISGGIMSSLGLTGVKKHPEPAPVVSEEKAEEVLTGFSAVVDAYDRNDLTEANKQINRVQRIDASSSAIRFYADLLAVYTSRFKIVAAPYYPLENPAALARLGSDMAYLQLNIASVGPWGGKVWEPNSHKAYPLSDSYGDYEFGVSESDVRIALGYRAPLANSSGWGIELFFSGVQSRYQDYGNTSESFIPHTYAGGMGSFGLALGPVFSIGLSGTGIYSFGELTYLSDGETKHEEFSELFFALAAGLVVKNSSGSFVYSLYGGGANQTWYVADLENYFDPEKEGEVWGSRDPDFNRPIEEKAPFYLDQTISLGFGGNRTFIILKHMADFWLLGGPQPYMQLIGAVEQRFSDRLSLRAGGGWAFTLSETMQGGPGGNLGLTWTFRSGWELDLSSTLRSRPSKVEPSEIVPELSVNLGLSRSGLFKERR